MDGPQASKDYGHSWSSEQGRADTKERVDDYPAVMGWDIGGVELGDEKNLDGVPFDYMTRAIVEQHQRGGINTISWHANNPMSGGNSWDLDSISVRNILNDSEVSASLMCCSVGLVPFWTAWLGKLGG